MGEQHSRLLVVPSAEHAQELLLARARRSGFADGSTLRTFAQLVEGFDGPGFLGRRAIAPVTARFLISEVARDAGRSPFGEFVAEPAFARAAGDLFSDVKAGGLDAAGFRDAVESLGDGARARARFLARVFERYEARLEKLGLADRADVLRGATERVRQEGLGELREFGALHLQGLHDFSPAREAFVLALAQACEGEGIGFSLRLPAGGSSIVDAAIEPLMRSFEAQYEALPNAELGKAFAETPLAPLGEWLFGSGTEDGAAAPLLSHLTLTSLGTAREEVRFLARAVRDALAEGTPPEEIAVCFRDLGEESEALVEELGALGIPARTRLGAPLQASAAGRLALELPQLVEDGYPAAAVSRILTSRYAPTVSRLSPDAPRAWLAQAGIRDDVLGAVGERGAYAVRLEALARRLASRGEGGKVRRLMEATSALLEATRLPEEASAGAFLEAWWRSLQSLGLFKALRRSEPRDGEGSALGKAVLSTLARDQAAGVALEALAGALRDALQESGSQSRRMKRSAFIRWLQDSAQDLNLAPQGPRAGAVQLLEVRELVGRRFARVFVGGLVDGRFPGRPTPHFLFGDEERLAINRALRRQVFRLRSGDDEGRAPWRLAEDRLLFFQALAASEGPVVLTWPSADASGRELTVSPFIDELCRLTGAKPRRQPAFAIPSLSLVRSEADLHERLLHESMAPVSLRSGPPELDPLVVRARLQGEPWFEGASAAAAMEDERLRFFSDPGRGSGAYTGRVALDGVLAERLAFDTRPLSASALNAFGNCRFQGLLQYLLRVRTRETPGEEMDPLVRGNFWHEVLERLFPKLREAKLLGRPFGEVPQELIDEVIHEASESLEAKAHVGHPELWRLGRERARGMVARLLSAENRGLPFSPLEPSETEWVFGPRSEVETWQSIVLPGANPGDPVVSVEGKIDRVDRCGAAMGMLDYKASSVEKRQKKEAFLTADFQLPLYLFAARAAGHTGPLQGAWLSLRDGSVVLLEDVFDGDLETLLTVDPELRRRAEETGEPNLANAVHALVGRVRAGDFAPRAHDCARCDFRSVCRISERRIEEGTA